MYVWFVLYFQTVMLCKLFEIINTSSKDSILHMHLQSNTNLIYLSRIELEVSFDQNFLNCPKS